MNNKLFDVPKHITDQLDELHNMLHDECFRKWKQQPHTIETFYHEERDDKKHVINFQGVTNNIFNFVLEFTSMNYYANNEPEHNTYLYHIVFKRFCREIFSENYTNIDLKYCNPQMLLDDWEFYTWENFAAFLNTMRLKYV